MFKSITAEEAFSFVKDNLLEEDKKYYSVSLEYFEQQNIKPFGLYVGKELAGIGCLSQYSFRETDFYPQKLGFSEEQSKTLLRVEASLVSPKHRGKGLQRRLLEELERVAIVGGFEYLILSVHPDNTSSKIPVERVGFELGVASENHNAELRLLYRKMIKRERV